jgi:hypothetical protein
METREERMEAQALRQRVLEGMLEQVREDTFPSVAIMNRIEASLQTREQLEEYADILLEKLESTPFPSLAMRNRLDAIIDRLG